MELVISKKREKVRKRVNKLLLFEIDQLID